MRTGPQNAGGSPDSHGIGAIPSLAWESGLDEDSPETREVQPPSRGIVIEIPMVGGLHHRYERRAA